MSSHTALITGFPPTPEGEDTMNDAKSQVKPFTLTPSDLGDSEPLNGTGVFDTVDVVETQTVPTSSQALSRFEFETGKGNEGTKILMVEWDSSIRNTTIAGEGVNGGSMEQQDEWCVAWDGKDTSKVVTTRDATVDKASSIRRHYFLLPPGVHVPSLVTIAWGRNNGKDNDNDNKNNSKVTLQTRPMPAIYPAGLGPDAHDYGKRGVLHTLWARQRLADLEAEIEAEMKANSESIGLQIAIQEHESIAEHFGVGGPGTYQPHPMSPTAPINPRSPVGGKLGEKLKGLKLATSPAELAAASQGNRGRRSIPLTAPPIGMHRSLAAVACGGMVTEGPSADVDAVEGEDELFALPMSPRSPEMAKSPFSLLR